ncbi:MAG TPA: hypothetical protein VHQ01_03405, partial [Pyrinomonadaceae bacterium]|nr:hypothetical protein [Pyrinomonadaceae bacterium]
MHIRKIASFFLAAAFASGVFAQQPNRPQLVAGFPVNYDEDKVGSYTLPDPLVFADGKRVTTAKMWTDKRRPELLKLFEEIEYGKMPGRPPSMSFDVTDKGTPAFGGKALRKQVTIHFLKDSPEQKMNLLIYTPARSSKPVPLLLNISFSAPNQMTDDPGVMVGEIWNRESKKVKADQPSVFGKMNIEQFIDAGFGFATFYYGDVEPDFKDGLKYGIRGKYLKSGQTEPA